MVKINQDKLVRGLKLLMWQIQEDFNLCKNMYIYTENANSTCIHTATVLYHKQSYVNIFFAVSDKI